MDVSRGAAAETAGVLLGAARRSALGDIHQARAGGRFPRRGRLMPQFRSTRRVRHSAEKMFDLVAAVERYPEFVPLCQSLRVRRRNAGEDGRETLVADMTVAYRLIHEAFTSRVTLDKPNLKIAVAYLNGPFSHLDNRWTFKPTSETTCEVEF